jgi:hypothetical protein
MGKVPGVSFLPPEPAREKTLELRCPLGARRLFARMIQRGERPVYVHPDNLIEFSCYDCRHRMEQSGRRVQRVLHRYAVDGVLIETLVVE